MEVPIGLLSAVSDEDLNWPIPAFLVANTGVVVEKSVMSLAEVAAYGRKCRFAHIADTFSKNVSKRKVYWRHC